MPRWLLSLALVLLVGCGVAPSVDDDDSAAEEVASDDDDDVVGDDDDSTVVPPDAAGLQILPCSGGEDGCADEGPFIDGTCCAVGDSIVKLGTAGGSEVVDVETDGRWVWSCGGFGARLADLSDPEDPQLLGGIADRCQRIGVGPMTSDGKRAFYLTHHGDSWVQTPFLRGYTVDDDGTVNSLYLEGDPEVLFEGMAVAFGHLYVAAHAGGIRVYVLDDGVPSLVRVVPGFANARKMDVSGDRLYLIDEQEVQVLSLESPSNPELLQTLPTTGVPRDVDVHGDRLYVAVGNRGLDVFDVAADGSLTFDQTWVSDEGSTQAVAATDDFIALANWSHIAVLDPQLRRVGTQRTTPTPNFEQDLGVAAFGDILLADEWEGVHVYRWRPGYVAPDIHIDQDILSFQAADAATVTLRNRGFADLQTGALTAGEGFTVTPDSAVLQPGESLDVEVRRDGDLPGGLLRLIVPSNDPDTEQNPYRVTITAGDPGGIGEGDAINTDWAFVDPTGNDDLANVEGKVVVLAYFALF
jgi:hypothetical protein